MGTKPKKTTEPVKVSHFNWTDGLVLAGAAIIVPVAIFERNWFFLGLGIVLGAAIGVRVWLTTWLVNRTGKE